jgi:hypothetical protein
MADADTVVTVGALKGVEIFATGDWLGSKKVSADGAMLDRIVHNFTELNSISGFGVPGKLGHNTKPGDPAMGWMSSLVREGDKLVADFADVPSAIVDAIGKRRYNSVSIELYPQINHGGKTYKDVLGAVAFLGAEWPAVKGLKPLSAAKFSEAGGELVTLTSKEQDMPNEALKFTQDQADALVTAAVTKATSDLTAANTKLTTDLTAANTRADTAEAAIKSFAAEKTRAEFATVIDAAIKEGRLLDKDRAQLEAVAALFAGQKAKVGDKAMSGLDLFKAHVATMQPKVKFGEQGTGGTVERPGGGAKASDELAQRATAKVRAAGGSDKLSYEAAVDTVLAEDADLKARYTAGE